uniref:Peptidase S1 domain-containing protein n=1 Tax=Glossina brevipalpis TaxID=37001 RepID=A0A1A9W5M3_9MUSC
MSKFITLLFISFNVFIQGTHLNNLKAVGYNKLMDNDPHLTQHGLSKPSWIGNYNKLYVPSTNKTSFEGGGGKELLPRLTQCAQKKDRIKQSHSDLGFWHISSVHLGESDTSTNPDCISNVFGLVILAPKHVVVRIEQAIPHPLYKSKSKNSIHDIALLRLERNINFNEFISPICLPQNAENNKIKYDGTRMEVIGWGRTETTKGDKIKMKASVITVNAEKCRQLYLKKGIILTNTHICAVGERESDSCKGDSGGPLITSRTIKKSDTYYILMGIVSFGSRNCTLKDLPSVYTKVESYIDWILHTIKA